MARTSVSDIAAAVARRHHLGKKESADIVSEFFKIITEGLQSDKQVKVRGLGTFKVTYVKARESVNVNTGERVVIEGHDKVTFVPDNSMKEIVNKPFSQFTTVVVNDGVNFDSIDVAAEAEEQKQKEEQAAEDNTETTEEQNEPTEEETPETTEKEEESDATDNEDNSSETVEPQVEKQESKVEEDKPSPTSSAPTAEPLVSTPAETKEEPAETVQAKQPEDDNKPKEEPTPAQEHVEQDTEEPTHVVKKKIVNQEIVKQEVVEQKIIRSTSTDNGDADDTISRDYFDDQMDRSRRHHNRLLILAGALLVVGLIAGFFIGRYFTEQNTQQVAVADTTSKAVATPATTEKADTNTTDTTAKATPEVAEKPAEAQPADTTAADIKALNSDRRLRFGAYEITGVDKVIKLKKGQTMESYCNRYYGKETIVYFQVLNGVDKMGEGETMKVPKIRLKGQFRHRK